MTDRAPSVRAALLSPKCLVMAGLGFASGLPYTIVNDTATSMLAANKIDRATIGLLGAIGSVYAFKFLWAPLVDARAIPVLRGKRRAWLFLTQGTLVAIILLVAAFVSAESNSAVTLLGGLLVVLAFFSATQDIVVNGWTVDAFPGRELGIGSSMYVLGYRVAIVAAGALALVVAKHHGWAAAFVSLAAVMALGPALVLLTREPHRPSVEGGTEWADAFVDPLVELFRRLGWGALVVFLFILVFRLPDQLGASMQKPLLLDTLGYDLAQFGIARNGIGLVATIAGSLVGGVLAIRFGLVATLVVAGIMQAASNLGFVWMHQTVEPLAGAEMPWTSPPMVMLVVVSSVESFCGGLVGTAFVAWLMSLCTPRFGASQYALLTAGFALAGGIASGASGFLAVELQWTPFFVVSALAGIPGLLLLPLAVWLARPAPTPDETPG